MNRALLTIVALSLVSSLACSSTVQTKQGSGGSGGGSSDAGPDGGEGGSSVGGSAPTSTVFRLSFISDIPESIWANETDVAWDGGHWLSIYRGGTTIRKAKACEICSCDQCPNCPVCGAPCPTATEIASGAHLDWTWSGLEYPSSTCPASPSDTCLAETVAPPGDYVAWFCWGTGFDGTPPCPAEVTDVVCAEVPFQHPDPDGLVEHVVNNGG